MTLPLYSWGCGSPLAARIKVGSENARWVRKYDPAWVTRCRWCRGVGILDPQFQWVPPLGPVGTLDPMGISTKGNLYAYVHTLWNRHWKWGYVGARRLFTTVFLCMQLPNKLEVKQIKFCLIASNTQSIKSRKPCRRNYVHSCSFFVLNFIRAQYRINFLPVKSERTSAINYPFFFQDNGKQ